MRTHSRQFGVWGYTSPYNGGDLQQRLLSRGFGSFGRFLLLHRQRRVVPNVRSPRGFDRYAVTAIIAVIAVCCIAVSSSFLSCHLLLGNNITNMGEPKAPLGRTGIALMRWIRSMVPVSISFSNFLRTHLHCRPKTHYFEYVLVFLHPQHNNGAGSVSGTSTSLPISQWNVLCDRNR